MTASEFISIALSFPYTEENPHFDRRAFKVSNRRIFATLHESSNSVNLKLPKQDQVVYCDFGPAVYPVPNKWGEQGWTTFELSGISPELIQDALAVAYEQASKKNSAK